MKLYDNENPPLSRKFWNVKLFREIKMQSPDWLKLRINHCRILTALLIEKHAGACHSNTLFQAYVSFPYSIIKTRKKAKTFSAIFI